MNFQADVLFAVHAGYRYSGLQGSGDCAFVRA
jgi:hypothetical protein